MKPGILKAAALLTASLYVLPLAGCATANRTGRHPGTGLKGQSMHNITTRLTRLPKASPGINGLISTTPGTGLTGYATPRTDGLTGHSLMPGSTVSPRRGMAAHPAADGKVRANSIRNSLLKNKDLSRVNVLIHGDNAIVGCVPTKAGTSRDMHSLKTTIAKTVKHLDPGIKNVYISESRKISDEIGSLSSRIGPTTGSRLDSEVKSLMKKVPLVAR